VLKAFRQKPETQILAGRSATNESGVRLTFNLMAQGKGVTL
jgi:hypothetical protein